MNYGSSVLSKTFNQCGDFLKAERGSEADQRVIKKVIELSNTVSKNYEDFNLQLKEPNFFQKLLLILSTKGGKSYSQRVQQSAITNYNLLIELQKSCLAWKDMLVDTMGQITNSSIEDKDNAILLEKYLVAGHIAQGRIEKEINEQKSKYDESGLQIYAQSYNELKEGYDIFLTVMHNLEKSRVMYNLSIAQLTLVQKSNYNAQLTINTQMNNTLPSIAKQLTIAIMDAKNREVIEGQQSITRLNDGLMVEVSDSIAHTVEESQKNRYSGFYNIESARKAVDLIVSSSKNIQATAEEMFSKMKAEQVEIDKLVEELKPYVNKAEQGNSIDNNTNLKTSGSSTGLKF